MSIVDLYGHERLREQIAGAISRDALPSSMLFHGPRGVGKPQRLVNRRRAATIATRSRVRDGRQVAVGISAIMHTERAIPTFGERTQLAPFRPADDTHTTGRRVASRTFAFHGTPFLLVRYSAAVSSATSGAVSSGS